MIFPYLGTPFQGVSAALIAVLGGLGIWYIRGWPDRRRASNETVTLAAKIEEDLRGESAIRFQEFRAEVHGLRNELQAVRGELQRSMAQSLRRGDKLDMVLFILRLVMDELTRLDPKSAILAQAQSLLNRVDDERRDVGNSKALNTAEDTVDSAKETVREVRATEATERGAQAARDAANGDGK